MSTNKYELQVIDYSRKILNIYNNPSKDIYLRSRYINVIKLVESKR